MTDALRFERGPDGEDVNEAARGEVLDRATTSGDLSLLRFLVEQEALCRANSGGGLGEQAALAGFLLAEHRRPEDVWRHHALKRSNFDAGCAYDVEHLVAGGIEATKRYVEASDHPHRADVLALIGGFEDEDDVEEWFEHRRAYFED
ncbi:hypothetical protein JNUCC0626_17520 [Lentzea sp. JNUCC 0626]|uniref:hypothetical protein n=1 Tax=Lentzea sp. JNUCC 0626 TaxID=3367513 RepID=UPI00374A0326